MTLQSWAKQYAKRNGLVFKDFVYDHYRVSNGKKYVDFWTNGSFRRLDGKFTTVTQGHSGIDEIGDYKDCPEIVSEIKKIPSPINDK